MGKAVFHRLVYKETQLQTCITISRHTAFKTASGSGSDGAVLPLSKLYST